MFKKLILGTLFAISSLIGFSQSSLTSGLVHAWKADEGSGTTIDDAVGTNNITITNITWVANSPEPPDSNSIVFDANGDYGTLTTPITYTTGTFAAWIKVTSLTDDRLLFANNGYQSRIFVSTGNLLKLETNTNGQEFEAGLNISTGVWTHVVIARDGNTVSFYKNGVHLTSGTISGADALTVSQIGFNGRSMLGGMDEILYWNRALTAAEVDTLYNGPTGTGPFYYPFVVNSSVPEVPGDTTDVVNTTLLGYDSTYVLAIRQEAYIPEEVQNGDYVGEWKKNITWRSGNTINYSIESDPLSAFAITKVSNDMARVTVSDYTKINGKRSAQDTVVHLMIRTTDMAIGYEVDTFAIHISEASYDHFIDYSYAGTESSEGTNRGQPRNDFDDLTPTAGHKYWFKRGVTITGETSVFETQVATAVHPLVVGAYGSGYNPIFNGAGAQSIAFYNGIDGGATRSEYVVYSDITIKNYTSAAIYIRRPSLGMRLNNLKINNCNINDYESSVSFNTQNYADSATVMPIWVQNCSFDSTSSGTDAYSVWEQNYLKLGAGPAYVYNTSFGPTTNNSVGGNHGLRVTNGQHGYVKHCIVNTGNRSGASWSSAIQYRGKYYHFIDNYIIGNACGIDMINNPEIYSFPSITLFRNNLFRNNVNYGIYSAPSASNVLPNANSVYENNLFDGNASGIYLKNHTGAIIRRNTFKKGTGYGIEGSTTMVNTNTSILYNVAYNYNSYEIYIPNSTGLVVRNNTIDGDINLIGSTSPSVRSNFYYSSSTGTSNNLDIDNITTANYFTNYTGHDYRLKSTATLAINHGYAAAPGFDIMGTATPYGDSTDIGAYEYTLPAVAAIGKVFKKGNGPYKMFRKGSGPYKLFSYNAIPLAPTDTIKYFLYDELDELTSASINNYDSLINRFPINGFYMPNQQAIVDVGGTNGKVWEMTIPYLGETASQLQINLNDTTSDCWFGFDFKCASNFTSTPVGGPSNAHSKYPGGMYFTDNLQADTDTTINEGGLGGWVGWVVGSSNNLMVYPYYQGMNADANGSNGQIYLPTTQKIHVMFHVRVNTPGMHDGFVEIYVNGIMTHKYTGLKCRSYVQGEHFGKIEMLRLMYFFGASERASAQENKLWIDRFTSYTYKEGSVMYGKPVGNIGDRAPIVYPPSTTRLMPPDLLVNETYTNPNDTIYDMGKDHWYLHWPYYKKQEIVKEVILSSGTIKYNFITEQFGMDWPGPCPYVKVYSGRGAGKVLLKTFGRNSGCGYEDPFGDYTINNKEATFVIYPGATYGDTKGIAISYSQQ